MADKCEGCRMKIYDISCGGCCNREKCQTCYKQPTNADRIRAMTDEEIAKIPARFGYSCVFPKKECGEDDNCEKCLLEWLKQPAKE